MRTLFIARQKLGKTVEIDRMPGAVPIPVGEAVELRIPDRNWTSFKGKVIQMKRKTFIVELEGDDWKNFIEPKPEVAREKVVDNGKGRNT